MLLDEPTAGMDPASRRTVWKTISDAKRGRAVVLTTHFLDEADALGDRVAILHRGRLQAVGTTAQLKRQTAGAFRLTLTRPRAGGAAAEEIVAAARAHVPGAVLLAEDETELALALPQAATASFGPLFTELDARAHELGVTSCALATHSNLGQSVCTSADPPSVSRRALYDLSLCDLSTPLLHGSTYYDRRARHPHAARGIPQDHRPGGRGAARGRRGATVRGSHGCGRHGRRAARAAHQYHPRRGARRALRRAQGGALGRNAAALGRVGAA